MWKHFLWNVKRQLLAVGERAISVINELFKTGKCVLLEISITWYSGSPSLYHNPLFKQILYSSHMDVNMAIKQNITKITWYSIRFIPLQLNEVVSLSKAGIYILYYLEITICQR